MATGDLVNNVAKSMLKKLESEDLASHQVQKLKNPLTMISQLLETGEDAETMANVMYEADDLVDEAATHVAKSSHSKVCYHPFSSSSYHFGRKIERVCKELVWVAGRGMLSKSFGSDQSFSSSIYSPDDEPVIGSGREKDIVNSLLDTSNLKDDISVVTIVGMGGSGKTTLAKMVYNDERVADYFDLRLWVCVGYHFDVRTIISNIVTCCLPPTKQTTDALVLLDRLIFLLQTVIRDKVFLLVLDDVWNEDRQKWSSFQSTLTVGARGSRILVTTRSKACAAACSVSDNLKWELSLMSKEEAHQLFIREAQRINWKDIFAAIMNCNHFVNNAVNINIETFCDFPAAFKSCFAYLTLLPRDFELNMLDVVSLWQAQGFLEATEEFPDEDNPLEDLVCNFFPEDLPFDENGKLATFRINDLPYSLPLNINSWEKNQCLIHGRVPILLLGNLVNNQKLRTFLYGTAPGGVDRINRIREVKMLSKFKGLRVLDLQAFGIQILPDSICNLIHLRYLDLSHNHSLVNLPNSISNLYNLQTLKLNFCSDLKELPTNTRKLACLKRLEIDGCEKLTFMPPGFENLTSLRILSHYVVGRPRFRSTSGFQSLGNLNRLQGRLMIELSENWTAAVNDATKSNLSSKTRLKVLAIKWGPARRASKTDSLKHQMMLDGLQPPPNLEMLHIEGYRGPDFPRWAKANTLATALPELVNVSIDGGGQCKTLPPFSRLPHLRRLTLRFMDNVQFFENSDNESSAPESQFFPALEELTLHSFYCLERWCENETLVSSLSFDCLKKLKLWSCPKLESMPLFPDVEVLDLQNINKKLLEVPNVTTLPSSSSSEATNLVPRGHPQNLPLLETLHVKGCPSLKTLALGKNSGKLKQLVVERLDTLSSLTEVLKQLTSLEELEISSCKDLDLSGGCQRSSCGECDECSIPWKSLSTLRRLTLRELTKIVTLPVGLGSIKTLKSICISACNNLSVLPEWVSKFSSLQHLRLEGCLALSELPEQLKDIKSLVKVDIIECPKLMERCRKGGEDWHKIKHARVLCHKSWRYALMSEAELSQKPKRQGENIAVHSEDPTIHVDVTVRRQPNRNM